MINAYVLTMPGNNSWNGKWTGDGVLYAVVRKYRKDAPEEKSHTYSFGDGWVARVEVLQVNSSEAQKLRRKTKGFCGYEWMIDSIERRGSISANEEG